MNHYPIAVSDTGALTLEKLRPFYTTPKGIAILGASAGVGMLVGGKKHRALGAIGGVALLIGVLYAGSPLG